MSHVMKAAFLFITPDAESNLHLGWVRTPTVHVKTIAVASYQQACEVLDSLIAEGILAVELCAGFGHQGVADVYQAAAGRIAVGVVRFEHHPLLKFVSGDQHFSGSDKPHI